MASEGAVQEKFSLIELVQCYPVLYDPSRDDYKSKNCKEEAWKQVADRLFQRDCGAAGKDNFVIILFFKHLTFIEIMQGGIFNQRFGSLFI